MRITANTKTRKTLRLEKLKSANVKTQHVEKTYSPIQSNSSNIITLIDSSDLLVMTNVRPFIQLSKLQELEPTRFFVRRAETGKRRRPKE